MNFKSYLLEQDDIFESKEVFIKKLKASYPNGLPLSSAPKKVIIGSFQFDLDGFTIPSLRSKLDLRETDIGKIYYVYMSEDKKSIVKSLGYWDFSIDFDIIAKFK